MFTGEDLSQVVSQVETVENERYSMKLSQVVSQVKVTCSRLILPMERKDGIKDVALSDP